MLAFVYKTTSPARDTQSTVNSNELYVIIAPTCLLSPSLAFDFGFPFAFALALAFAFASTLSLKLASFFTYTSAAFTIESPLNKRTSLLNSGEI